MPQGVEFISRSTDRLGVAPLAERLQAVRESSVMVPILKILTASVQGRLTGPLADKVFAIELEAIALTIIVRWTQERYYEDCNWFHFLSSRTYTLYL